MALAPGRNQIATDSGEDPTAPKNLRHFDPRLADSFITRSISKATRRTYSKAVKEFFLFVKDLHPTDVRSDHVIAYRDQLIGHKKSANTIALKLSIIRSFYGYLIAEGHAEDGKSTRLNSSHSSI